MIFAHVDIDAEERSVIVVVLDARNLAEMRIADPLTLEMSWGGNAFEVAGGILRTAPSSPRLPLWQYQRRMPLAASLRSHGCLLASAARGQAAVPHLRWVLRGPAPLPCSHAR